MEPNQGINLSGLASHWIAAHGFVPAATADYTDGFAFYYLPCSPVPTLTCDFPNAAGMCQTEFGESQWSCGLESSAELICDKNSVTVLKFSDGTGGRSATIQFIFDPHAGMGNFSYVSRSALSFQFEWSTSFISPLVS